LTPNDAPPSEAIARRKLTPPAFLNWSLPYPWISYSSELNVYDASLELWNWLKAKPCFTLSKDKARFLGYEQAWRFVLGAILYLQAREAYRSFNSDASKIAGPSRSPKRPPLWQLDSRNCFVSLKPEDIGFFTAVLLDFDCNIERVSLTYKWPGVAPSIKYSAFYSRTAYLRGLLKSHGAFLQLISLSESLVCF
jgi:hypothetical protein